MYRLISEEKMTSERGKGVPVFARAVSFEEVFPEIEDLRVEVRYENELSPRIFSKRNLPGDRTDCRNPLCRGGGYPIADALHDMVNNKKTDFEGSQLCQGQEGHLRTGRACLRWIEVKVSIKYKTTTSLSGSTVTEAEPSPG